MSTLASPSTSLIFVWRTLHPPALAESIDSGDTSISARDAAPGGGEGGGCFLEGGVLRAWAANEGDEEEEEAEEEGTRRAAPGPPLKPM
jgi:hypothetical protein